MSDTTEEQEKNQSQLGKATIHHETDRKHKFIVKLQSFRLKRFRCRSKFVVTFVGVLCLTLFGILHFEGRRSQENEIYQGK